MKVYEITFGGEYHDKRDVAMGLFFCVKKGDIKFYIPVCISRMLATCWGLQQRFLSAEEEKALEQTELLKDYLFRIGLPQLKDRLKTFELPPEAKSEPPFEIFLSTKNEPGERPVLKKSCRFQKKTDRGYMCSVFDENNDESKGITSPVLCETCELPDEEERCYHLSHPTTKLLRIPGEEGLAKRMVEGAVCDAGMTALKVKECVPGGRDCWKQIYEVPTPIAKIPEDISDRVADEIDYLNLSFEHKYKAKPIEIKHARSIMDLSGVVITEEQFTYKVAVVGDLINQIHIDKVLTPEENNLKGSLKRLEAFLTRNYPKTPLGAVKKLRQIVDIRNGFPVHSRNARLLRAFKSLDIEYPPISWNDAWQKILYAFWESLRQIRKIIQ